MYNELPVGDNSPTFTCTPVEHDGIYVLMTSDAECWGGNIPRSVTYFIGYPGPTQVEVMPDANPVCPGEMVNFRVHARYYGASPSCQWKVNGVNAGTNSAFFSYIPNDNDHVTATIISYKCHVMDTATSAPLVMSVIPVWRLMYRLRPTSTPHALK